MELQPAEELAIARRRSCLTSAFTSTDRSNTACARRDVVAVDQPLGRHVVEPQQPVLVAQVGEEGVHHRVGRQVQLAGDGLDDLVAPEDISAWPGPAAPVRI